jgi:hypothetical protein
MTDQVKLDAPADAAQVSWKGEEFTVEGGSVSVPTEAVADLAAHGFSIPKTRKGKADGASA